MIKQDRQERNDARLDRGRLHQRSEIIAVERISTKDPSIARLVSLFDDGHLEKETLKSLNRVYISTVRKSTLRMTWASMFARILPPHNCRVHVSNDGAWAMRITSAKDTSIRSVVVFVEPTDEENVQWLRCRWTIDPFMFMQLQNRFGNDITTSVEL
jgi:hypothetical protein